MELKQAFNEAKDQIEELQTRPSNEELLELYAHYKQATIGDNTSEEPGGLDFKAAAKHRAWKKLEGMDEEIAMTKYIDLANSLLEKYGN